MLHIKKYNYNYNNYKMHIKRYLKLLKSFKLGKSINETLNKIYYFKTFEKHTLKGLNILKCFANNYSI